MSDGMLIVSGKKEFGEQLRRIIAAGVPGSHEIALSGAEVRRKTALSDYTSVLISDRLPDENTIDLALELADRGCAGVMLVVDRDAIFDAHEVLDGTGVTILVKPVTKSALVHTIQLVMKVEEGGGTFAKAKLMLVQMKKFNESQAHRYIQKISMDKRIPRDIAAQMVIKALEREIAASPQRQASSR